MKITRKLKYATFEYDEETKHFTIEAEDANADSTEKKFFKIRLGKVYAFAFMRFVVRMAQRNWLRNKKSSDKNEDSIFKSKNQMEIFQ